MLSSFEDHLNRKSNGPDAYVHTCPLSSSQISNPERTVGSFAMAFYGGRISMQGLGRSGLVTKCFHGSEQAKLRRRAPVGGRNGGALRSAASVATGETVEAVFVFHRHGDRTPGKSLVADEFVEDEASFWRTKIPPSDRSYHQMLSERFPVIRPGLSNKKIPTPEQSPFLLFKELQGGNESYGFLTWKGMHQMYHNGAAMAKRYGLLPHGSFRDHWDIEAFSTNYLRTVKSCQAFLDGLLSDTVSKTTDRVPLDYKQPTHYEGIDLAEYHRARTTSDYDTTVEIKVRQGENETLNPFDSAPQLMKNLMEDAKAAPDFIERDAGAATLKAQLLEYIPGLSRHSSSTEKTSAPVVNWIDAADYFVCRSSHSMPVHKFCVDDGRDNETAETRFRSLGRETFSHLLSRFRGYYVHPPLLAEVAGPALDEIRSTMRQVVGTTEADIFGAAKKPFHIYSCHDVTLLGLLYAVKDRFLIEDTDRFRSLSSQWPTYASCLTFELVRRTAKGKSKDDEEFAVKLWLNQAPIPNFCPRPVALLQAPQAEIVHSIGLEDFNKLIDELNAEREFYCSGR